MKYKTFLFFSGFSFLFPFHSLSQDTLYPKPTHSIYLELGGGGLVYSVNYECVFIKKRLPDFALRVGGEVIHYSNDAYYDLKKPASAVFIMPLEILIISNYINAFEFGGGISPAFGDRYYYSISSPSPSSGKGYIIHYSFDMMPFFEFGYRFQSTSQHGIFKIHFTELFLSKTFEGDSHRKYQSWAGIAYGYCFK